MTPPKLTTQVQVGEATETLLPFDRAVIHEVGPRDGFQMVKDWIPTEIKLEVIEGLLAAGIDTMQFTSFVNPKAVPQLKDAAEVTRNVLDKHGPLKLSALVPNAKGAQLAHAAGLRKLDLVISVSEAHNQANVGMTHEQSWQQLEQIQQDFPDVELRLDLATLFSCPYKGVTPLDLALQVVGRAYESGVREMCLSDTMGTANPSQTRLYLNTISTQFPKVRFHLHFHDTCGMAMLNYFVAAQMGFTHFESSIAGLGGCPFAPGASGNLATEDLVNMFQSIGVETGIRLDELLRVSGLVKAKIEPHPSGRLVYQQKLKC